MSEWAEYNLCDLADIYNHIRIPLSKMDRANRQGVYPYYGASGIIDYVDDYLFDGEYVLISEDGENLRSRKTPIAFKASGKFWVNNHAQIIQGKKAHLNNLLVYFFQNLDLSPYITGAVQPKLSKKSLLSIPILLPKREEEQKAIADVLSSLDDKIDLLQRQNQTLESLAQTLFRQWFIEEAQNEWEVKRLRDVCDIKNGYAFKSKTYQDEGYKIIRTVNFDNHLVTLNGLTYISHEFAKEFKKFNLKRFDYLLVMVGASLGNFAIVTKDILPALQNQNMWCFRARAHISQHYLNFAIQDIVNENLHSSSGSARQFFQKSVFYNFEIVVPPTSLIKKFTEAAENIYSKIELNQAQIRTLETLRDTLLPKLMSGAVRVRMN